MKTNNNDVKVLKSLVEKYGANDVIGAVKVLNELSDELIDKSIERATSKGRYGQVKRMENIRDAKNEVNQRALILEFIPIVKKRLGELYEKYSSRFENLDDIDLIGVFDKNEQITKMRICSNVVTAHNYFSIESVESFVSDFSRRCREALKEDDIDIETLMRDGLTVSASCKITGLNFSTRVDSNIIARFFADFVSYILGPLCLEFIKRYGKLTGNGPATNYILTQIEQKIDTFTDWHKYKEEFRR